MRSGTCIYARAVSAPAIRPIEYGEGEGACNTTTTRSPKALKPTGDWISTTTANIIMNMVPCPAS